MKFQKWLDEQTTTGDIALNLAKGGKHGGGVDVIGADCPDGQKWDKKKGKCVGSRLKESLVDEAKGLSMSYLKRIVPDEYLKDPLYMKVLMAKDIKEYDKAYDTLKKIRGETAVKNFISKLPPGMYPHKGKAAKMRSKISEEKIPSKPLSTPEKHQLKIAKDTLKMSNTMAKVMGGMSKKEAKKIIEKFKKEGKITESLDEAARPLFKIAMDIGRDWKKVNYAAKPYLDAMSQLEFINDMYFMDSAREVVARFLANAGTWKGPVAKKIKTELKSMLKR